MQFVGALKTENEILPLLVRVNRRRQEIFIKLGNGKGNSEKIFPMAQDYYDAIDETEKTEFAAKLKSGESFVL